MLRGSNSDNVIDLTEENPDQEVVMLTTVSWPSSVQLISKNIYCLDHPFPAITNYPTGICGCQNGTCNNSFESATCWNQASCIICDDRTCANGDNCGNRFREIYPVVVAESKIGFGAFALVNIPRGEFVIEYTGELLYHSDANRRDDKRFMVEMQNRTTRGDKVFLDAKFYGNASRFANHSCNPNCEMFEFVWHNTSRLGIFASQDIQALEELTFCYNLEQILFNCKCGNDNCVSLGQCSA